jgi:hypothetical protein
VNVACLKVSFQLWPGQSKERHEYFSAEEGSLAAI